MGKGGVGRRGGSDEREASKEGGRRKEMVDREERGRNSWGKRGTQDRKERESEEEKKEGGGRILEDGGGNWEYREERKNANSGIREEERELARRKGDLGRKGRKQRKEGVRGRRGGGRTWAGSNRRRLRS